MDHGGPKRARNRKRWIEAKGSLQPTESPLLGDAIAISLWENRADAEAYNTNTYPEVLKTLARMIDGTPKVQTFEAVTSTFHKVAVAA